MPNLPLSKILALVALTSFVVYSSVRLIMSSEPLLNMVGYVFMAISILFVGAYYIYKFIDTEGRNGDVY